jgi:aminopeptidase
VSSGEVVVISGAEIADRLIDELVRECYEVGAKPLVRRGADLCLDTHVRSTSDHIEFFNPLNVPSGDPISCSIGIWSKQTRRLSPVLERPLDPDRERQIQTDFLDRAASGKIRWVAVLFPTLAAAQDAGMTLRDFRKLVTRAGMLDTKSPAVQWQRMRDRQQLLCDFLNNASEIRFVTAAGTDLSLNVKGRHWINCDARYNYPDGEVFTAPIEDSLEGVFMGSFPTEHEACVIDGIRLQFRGGRIVNASARLGEEALLALIRRDAGSGVVGELGMGTNYRLSRPTRTSLLDEKIGGTFHIALGSAYPQTGGTNQSSIHRDFIADLRAGGVLSVDGETISTDGRFHHPDWPRMDRTPRFWDRVGGF